MRVRNYLWLVLVALLLGCSNLSDISLFPTPTPVPTPTPSPTPTPLPTPTVQPTGLIILDESNCKIYRYPPSSFVHPLRLAVAGETAYVIDGGTLKMVELKAGGQVSVLLPPEGLVEGVPIKELGDLAAVEDGSMILLDRSGDVYRLKDEIWSVERLATAPEAAPRQYLASVAAYGDAFYLLDINLGQIWQVRGDSTSVIVEGFANSIDFAVDGSIYVLTEGESLVKAAAPSYQNQELGPPNISETSLLFVNENYLYVIDDRYHRLLLLDKDTGNLVRQYLLRSGEEIRAVYAEGDRLYIASRDTIYAYPGITTVLPGPEPNEAGPQLPHDPRILYTLPNFTLPIEGVLVPDLAFRLPGAPRAYRYGVHEGIDFYKGPNWGVTRDTPLLAMADGVVVRADWDYADPTPDEMETMLNDAYQAHYTSRQILDKLRGRQVWIDQGAGIVVRYCHMSRIAEGIELGTVVPRGTLLGYAGNSGTPEAKYGEDSGVHLHLEIRIGDGYLGEYLRPAEVVRWLEWLFRR